MPPLSIMLKPASSLCNLRCQYCFYADEAAHREQASYGIMSEDTLEAILKRTLAFAEGSCTIVYQGGEPTLAGLDFFRRAIALETKWNVNGVAIHHSIQTNGMMLNREWAAFFKEHRFLVGLSLDGNRKVHDANRLDPSGQGTFRRVMESLNLLKEYKVEFNVLTVVTRQTVPQIKQIYHFFSRLGVEYQQYIPCLDPLEAAPGTQGYSLDEESYLSFLKSLFDCWYPEAKQGHLRYVRYFIGLMNLLSGNPPGVCEMNGVCSRQYVVEADGSVYPCDFYMLDGYCIGNLTEDTLEAVDARRKELGFLEQSLPVEEKCRACRWFPLCRGGCRRDRDYFEKGIGLNYFCPAYRDFFEYAYPRLERLYRMMAR